MIPPRARAGIVRLSMIVALVCFAGALVVAAVRGHVSGGTWLAAAAATSAVICGRIAMRGRR